MLTIRTPDGSIRELSLHHPPLRLRISRTNALLQELPADAIRRIFQFLEHESQDWLSADSCCRSWRLAAQPLWQGQRASIAVRLAASQRVSRTWNKLHGFLPSETYQALCGPATMAEVESLQEAVHPWKITPLFLESVRIHNGERERQWRTNIQGMYLGCRLLTISEIVATCQAWRKQAQEIQSTCTQDSPLQANTVESGILRIPLFSERASRQVAMELHQLENNDRSRESAPLDHHGRIVMISSVAPFAPHFRVLADTWDGFLTLI